MIYGGPLCGRGPAEWRRVRARLCMFCGCVCNWSQKLRLRLSASTKAIQSKLNWTEPRWRGGALCNWNSKSFLVWQFCKRNCRCLALVIVFCAVIRRNVARLFFFFLERSRERVTVGQARASVLYDEGFSILFSFSVQFSFFFFGVAGLTSCAGNSGFRCSFLCKL